MPCEEASSEAVKTHIWTMRSTAIRAIAASMAVIPRSRPDARDLNAPSVCRSTPRATSLSPLRLIRIFGRGRLGGPCRTDPSAPRKSPRGRDTRGGLLRGRSRRRTTGACTSGCRRRTSPRPGGSRCTRPAGPDSGRASRRRPELRPGARSPLGRRAGLSANPEVADEHGRGSSGRGTCRTGGARRSARPRRRSKTPPSRAAGGPGPKVSCAPSHM